MTIRQSITAAFSFLAVAACLLPHSNAEAGYVVATDSAADAVYDAGWTNGQDGGTGWGSAWTINGGAGAFSFVSSSTSNGGGSLGIDTAGRSWGMRSNDGGSVIEGIREFANPLGIGDKFSIDFDNGFINAGSSGFGLRNANDDNLFEFFFEGGDANYSINDQTTNFDTGLGFTADGLHLELTRTGTSTYSLSLTDLGAASTLTFNRTFSTLGDFDPAKLRVFNFQNGDGDPNNNAFYNSISIEVVPEPSTSLLVGLGLIAVANRRRRKNR